MLKILFLSLWASPSCSHGRVHALYLSKKKGGGEEERKEVWREEGRKEGRKEGKIEKKGRKEENKNNIPKFMTCSKSCMEEAYIKKERSQINNLTLQLKELEEELNQELDKVKKY